jgi:putative ATP-dependent endonuclease of OLD family
MRLVAVHIENFRCYRAPIRIGFDELTTLVGKNDVGKSTILEALEIFFNNDTVCIDADDANVYGDDKRVSITCEFCNLPATLTLDAGAQTTLADEYLLSKTGTLQIRKIFDCTKKSPTAEVFIISHHPTASGVSDLLELKEKDLQQLVKSKQLGAPLKGNPGMRRALWESALDLKLAEVAVPMTKAKEDGKRIWEQLQTHLPLFALFQSDRSSRDSDGEVQNPLKAAIAAAISEVQTEINEIQRKVKEKAEDIARKTHEALKTLDPNLARNLTPQFVPPSASKWASLFSLGMDTHDGIPLNKRGSGVRRLVLVGFFKAEAERRLKTSNSRSIIYAVEEPEAAQHPNNQRILIQSFKSLATEQNCQVILTTHSPGFAADLPTSSIRFITRGDTEEPLVEEGSDVFGLVADSLGVTPDSRVRVLLCLEGPTDVTDIRCLSRALHLDDPSVIDLSADERVAFVVLGGSTLKHWVAEHYLRGLRRPEAHIYDNDVNTYGEAVQQVNERGDASWATLTRKREIECYLHADAIKDAFGVDITIPDNLDEDGKDVPALFAEAYSKAQKFDGVMNSTLAKRKLAERAFPLMTAARIRDRDPAGEVEGWFRRLAEIISSHEQKPTVGRDTLQVRLEAVQLESPKGDQSGGSASIAGAE